VIETHQYISNFIPSQLPPESPLLQPYCFTYPTYNFMSQSITSPAFTSLPLLAFPALLLCSYNTPPVSFVLSIAASSLGYAVLVSPPASNDTSTPPSSAPTILRQTDVVHPNHRLFTFSPPTCIPLSSTVHSPLSRSSAFHLSPIRFGIFAPLRSFTFPVFSSSVIIAQLST